MPHTPLDPPLDVEWRKVDAEVFSDHTVLHPPNRLKERATQLIGPRGPGEAEAVHRAERALGMLSQEFASWMDAEIERLEEARKAFATQSSQGAADALYRVAHDLRGQAATLGYPLAGEIAEGLCVFIERLEERPLPQAVVDRHVESIRAIVRQDVRGRDNPLGVALTLRLAQLRAQYAPGIRAE